MAAARPAGLWFNFPGWGDYHLDGVAEKELVTTFAHGYPTQAEADSHPNASPSALQAGLLQTFNAASLDPVGAGVTGVLSTPHSTGGVSGLVGNAVGAATGGSNFSSWTQPNLILRVGEFAVGAILIYVGLRSMFPSQVQAVTGPIKTAAKVVK